MGNWTDRFDPETVDEIKRYEVGEGDFLLAERLAMHKGVESVFGFMYSSPYRSNTYSTRLPLPITSPAQTCHGRRGLLPAPILTAPSKSRP